MATTIKKQRDSRNHLITRATWYVMSPPCFPPCDYYHYVFLCDKFRGSAGSYHTFAGGNFTFAIIRGYSDSGIAPIDEENLWNFELSRKFTTFA